MTEQPVQPPGPASRPATNDGLASVVVIDKRDDVAAVCGRVDTAPTLAVVIHAPDGNRQLATQLGMRRLVRHAEDSGRVIAIATGKRGLATRARATGVPVGRKPNRIRWDAGGKRVLWLGPKGIPLPGIGRYAQFVVVLAAFAVGAAAVLTVAPSADVTASPPLQEGEVALLLSVSLDFEDSDIDALELPAEEVTTTRVVTLAGPATGLVQVPAGRAIVLVTLSNTGTTDVTIPYGTVVLSVPDGLEFTIDQETEVPGGTTVVQQVSAVDAGPEGNVPPGALVRWADEDFDAITVVNADAAAGGTLEERPGVSSADVASLEALAATIVASPEWTRALIEDRPDVGVVGRTTVAIVTQMTPRPAVGEAAPVVLLDVTVEITALAISADDLHALAEAYLAGDEEGALVGGTVRAVETGRAQVDDEGIYVGEFRLTGGFSEISEQEIKDAVKGKSPEDAESTLQERYGIQDAVVDLTPGFMPWLPRFDFRIDVALEVPGTEAVETAATPDAEPTGTPTPTQTPGP